MSAPPPQVRMAGGARSGAIVRVGLERRPLGDLYHSLLNASWWLLGALVLVLYLASNVVFALGYIAGGDSIENARHGSFSDAFFFSVQTMATIGYGKWAPQTLLAHLLVTLEALVGLVGLALVTGLVFAKFSRPSARVIFSRVAVISPWNGTPSLMFRMANERANQIVEAQLRAVLARNEVTAEGQSVRRFYDLELSRKQNAIFTLSWTAIHPIDERSPLHGATRDTLKAMEGEIIASLVGIDDTFAQTVHARHSYIADEMVWGGRFADIISRLPDGRRVIDYRLFHDVVPAEPSANPS
jgi:inward rectifier potassium channel